MTRSKSLLQKVSNRNVVLAWIVLLSGFVLTLLATYSTHRDLRDHEKREYELICNEIRTKITTRLHAHALLLRSGASFFYASDSVERTEWKEFVEKSKISENLPGIQGLGFSLIIPADKLQQHIQSVRNEGYPDYKVKPEGKRDIYTSIIYLEPFDNRNLRAFGYDMFSEPVRRKAMERSRDNDLAVLSGKVTLVQETKKDVQTGTLMYAPLYCKGKAVTTVDERRAAIKGWVYSPYRMTDLLDNILGQRGWMDDDRIQIRIYDNDIVSDETLLFDSHSNDSLAKQSASALTISLPVDFNGTHWLLCFSQNQDPVFTFFNKTLVVFGGGCIMSLLLFYLVFVLNKRKSFIKTLEQMSKQLKESEQQFKGLSNQLEAILDQIPGWVFHKDRNNHFLHVNQFVAKSLNKTKQELEGKDLAEVFPSADAEKYYQDDLLVIKTGIAKLNFEESWETADGTRWFNSSKIPFVDELGKTIGIIGISMDITERKEIESDLRKTTDELKKFNSYFVDREHKMISLKKEVNELLKKLGEEERYKNIVD
jgi:PAS domain S-box-containing protein